MNARNDDRSSSDSAADNAAIATSDDLAARIASLEQEVAEQKDKNLRLLAEMQNQQRRAQRDKDESLRYAESAFAKQLLVVLDGLERAQEACQSGADATAIAEGVRIVYDQFMKVLKDHHIQSFDAMDQPFDPHRHEAVAQRPSAHHPPGHVVEQVARGYEMHGRVLRPAKVIVSKEK